VSWVAARIGGVATGAVGVNQGCTRGNGKDAVGRIRSYRNSTAARQQEKRQEGRGGDEPPEWPPS